MLDRYSALGSISRCNGLVQVPTEQVKNMKEVTKNPELFVKFSQKAFEKCKKRA
jgi:hypothetical protein